VGVAPRGLHHTSVRLSPLSIPKLHRHAFSRSRGVHSPLQVVVDFAAVARNTRAKRGHRGAMPRACTRTERRRVHAHARSDPRRLTTIDPTVTARALALAREYRCGKKVVVRHRISSAGSNSRIWACARRKMLHAGRTPGNKHCNIATRRLIMRRRSSSPPGHLHRGACPRRSGLPPPRFRSARCCSSPSTQRASTALSHASTALSHAFGCRRRQV
jgi:hypothetical protein